MGYNQRDEKTGNRGDDENELLFDKKMENLSFTKVAV